MGISFEEALFFASAYTRRNPSRFLQQYVLVTPDAVHATDQDRYYVCNCPVPWGKINKYCAPEGEAILAQPLGRPKKSGKLDLSRNSFQVCGIEWEILTDPKLWTPPCKRLNFVTAMKAAEYKPITRELWAELKKSKGEVEFDELPNFDFGQCGRFVPREIAFVEAFGDNCSLSLVLRDGKQKLLVHW